MEHTAFAIVHCLAKDKPLSQTDNTSIKTPLTVVAFSTLKKRNTIFKLASPTLGNLIAPQMSACQFRCKADVVPTGRRAATGVLCNW